ADLRARKAHRQGAVSILVGDACAHDAIAHRRIPSLDNLADALPAGIERVAFVWDGIEEASGRAIEAAIGRLSGTAADVYGPGEQPNARGAEAVGCLPGPGGLDVRGMLEAARDGKLRSLAILGANPLLRYPDRALVDEALAKLDFLVVSELFPTATA